MVTSPSESIPSVTALMLNSVSVQLALVSSRIHLQAASTGPVPRAAPLSIFVLSR